MESHIRIIFKTLLSYTTGQNIYFFHEKYRFSPGHIADFIGRYHSNGIVEYANAQLNLTDLGKAFVNEHRKEIFMERERTWRQIPDEISLGFRMAINEPFIPVLKDHDKASFIKFVDKVMGK